MQAAKRGPMGAIQCNLHLTCCTLSGLPLQVFVDQPSVATTVSILRGLRSRYENYHGGVLVCRT